MRERDTCACVLCGPMFKKEEEEEESDTGEGAASRPFLPLPWLPEHARRYPREQQWRRWMSCHVTSLYLYTNHSSPCLGYGSLPRYSHSSGAATPLGHRPPQPSPASQWPGTAAPTPSTTTTTTATPPLTHCGVTSRIMSLGDHDGRVHLRHLRPCEGRKDPPTPVLGERMASISMRPLTPAAQ
ncbi:hypothetical protein E2C01_060621 [Portunus trituberculatus]|uniref:Uncharacterized protein n=1 Tax=Portunus trituberculatus TaxID=210409 RepID=A0A5B7H8L5_PORTR|nr:hypothetical protein [Portunus trituberculatus]